MSDDLRRRGLELLGKGDTAGGIADLKAHVAAEPDDAGAWLALGGAYLAIPHVPEAVAALKEAVELDGQNVDARLALSRALVGARKVDDAAFQLIQGSKVDPNDARVLLELGIVFYDKRLYDKAAGFLQRAVAGEPASVRARAWYALGLTEEARRDVGAAVAAYRRAVELDPRHAAAHMTLADALASMGEHEGAIAALDALERSASGRGLQAAQLEQAAHNREVLERALAEMRRSRLLGRGPRELEASALVTEGGLRKKEAPADALRFAAPLVEVHAALRPGQDEAPVVEALSLVLTDPERAAREDGDAFKVTVIAHDGGREKVDFATAATLTFLREALGCPMTQASALYARLLKGEVVEWGGATLGFESIARPDKPGAARHGLTVRLRT